MWDHFNTSGLAKYSTATGWEMWLALLHQFQSGRNNPNTKHSYAMAGTDTGAVIGRPSCAKRLIKATHICNSVTLRSNVRAITCSPRRLEQAFGPWVHSCCPMGSVRATKPRRVLRWIAFFKHQTALSATSYTLSGFSKNFQFLASSVR